MSAERETEITEGKQMWIDYLRENWLSVDPTAGPSIAKIVLSNGRTVEVIYSPYASDRDKWGIHHVTEEYTLIRLATGPDLLLQLHNAKFTLERIVSGTLPIRSHLRYL